MIEVKNVVKKFGSVEAVNGVSFAVAKGEVFGFLGPNGAGKTTTIRMMIGLLKPTDGEIFIDGIDVVNNAKAMHDKIGVVFDSPNFYERITVEQNLYFYASLYKIGKERVNELIKRFQLEEKRKAQFKKLSKGQKQRVTIIRALLHNPEILFLDELTSGLDPTSSEIIREQIRELKNEGTTIILTTHYMEEADQLCDMLAFISKGKIVAAGKPYELKLEHGERTIEVTYAIEDEVREKALNMDDQTTPDALSQLLKNEQILTLHSREATLAQVFIKLTGEEIL